MRYCFALLLCALFSVPVAAQTSYQTSTRLHDEADTPALSNTSAGTAQLDCPTTLLLGQEIVFNGSFSNTGTVPLDDVFFRMTVNDKLSLTQGSTTQGTWSGTTQQLQLNMGTVEPDQQVTFDLNIATVLSGTATIETVFGADGVSGTPESCEFEVIEQADLTIDKLVDQNTVLAGNTLNYLLIVGNAGPHTAMDIVIQDVLPPSVEVLDVSFEGGATATGVSCDVVDGTLTCQIEQLGVTTQSEDFLLINIQVMTTEPGTLENQASVTATTEDPNPENNDSPAVITMVEEPVPVLSITKTASVGPQVTVGSTFSYLVTVTNSGTGTASNVMMTDMLPGTVTVNTVTPSPGATCSQAGLTLTCNLGDIAPNGVVTVQIDVAAATVGNATNIARIDGGEASVELSITEEALSDIHGQKFLDLDGDGVKDPGEPGMNGVTIQLLDGTGAVIAQRVTASQDLDNDGKINAETEQGLFVFENVPDGMYTLREILPFGLAQTFPPPPGTHAVVVDASVQLDTFLFGNRLIMEEYDFGDAPDPRTDSSCPAIGGGYATLLATGGPFHVIVPDKPILGTRIDDEGDGQPDGPALGDDLNNVMVDDDEDGLVSFTILADGTIRFEIVATVPPGENAFVDAWVDLNDNCSFEQLAPPLSGGLDYVLVREPVVNGVNILTTAPGLADPDDLLGYTRLRISTTGTGFPTGGAPDGEVEDYYLIGLDFGDAPGSVDPNQPDFPGGYPTTLAQDGARHIAVSNVRLGDLIDVEGLVNGSIDALEDDNNKQQDDEDGIVFLDGFTVKSEMIAGETFEIVELAQGAEPLLLPLPSTDGRLDAWIDFNRDGDWEDAGEQIFESVDIGPEMDEDDALPVTVPQDAALGYTYARFRFSRNGGLSFKGGASIGEVEDYLLRIVDPSDTTPVEEQDALPTTFALRSTAPNPAHLTTTLHFDLPESAEVHVQVFDLLGRSVLPVVPHQMAAGVGRTLTIDASPLTSGMYLYRLTAHSATRTYTATGRFVLVK